MKTYGGYELTEHEESCIRSLKRLAKKWYKHTNRLWLFSANAHLAVLLGEGNGNKEPEFDIQGSVNKNNIVVGSENIDIPNDGGDW
jgi:hypothetical protein